jgi:hypothetical protein
MSDYNVKNRSAGMVIYSIPEIGIRREFAPGETKKISKGELEKLSYIAGGRELMSDFLQIQSAEVVQDLGLNVELEYNYSEADVIEIMKNGSLDAFLDTLDFAPVGILDLIKRFAVELPLNDIQKRDALKKKTGFDVTAALTHIVEEKAESNAPAEPVNTGRRVKVEEAPAGRRVTPKYNVVKTAADVKPTN